MDDVIIKKLQDKISASIRSRSNDIKLSISDANAIITEVLNLSSKIIKLQNDIIDLQEDDGEIIIAPTL